MKNDYRYPKVYKPGEDYVAPEDLLPAALKNNPLSALEQKWRNREPFIAQNLRAVGWEPPKSTVIMQKYVSKGEWA